jgi:predicted transcriptional regulator
MATRKVTFTLDEATIRRLQLASEQLHMPKSQVIRDAVADFHEGIGRLSEAERQRQLRVLREFAATIPDRSDDDVKKEIAEIRSVRRLGGRGGMRRGSR